MLPEPTLRFTLPSLHDGLPLDCRVYHPRSLIPAVNSPLAWERHAAVVAHPYAPLGGCYDDPNVELVAEALLRQGFLVATFNFRGAGHSVGRTSWSAKPERSDYMSVVGFLYYYTHFLDPFHRDAPPTESSSPTDAPVLLMGGYSYGAMVTMQLPPLPDILAMFCTPEVESPAAEVRQRAQHLAEQQNDILGTMLATKLEQARGLSMGNTSPRGLNMRVGEAGDQRKSHDSRRSMSLEEAEEKLRKGVHDLIAMAKHKPHDAPPELTPAMSAKSLADEIPRLNPIPGLVSRRPAYVLVSPLQGIANHLTALSLKPSSLTSWFTRKPAKISSADSGEATSPTSASEEPASDVRDAVDKVAAERKLIENPTLAAFGDQDVFVAVKKLRDWVARLQKGEGHKFRGLEITGAGHFWVEEGVAYEMQRRVMEFATAVLEGR